MDKKKIVFVLLSSALILVIVLASAAVRPASAAPQQGSALQSGGGFGDGVTAEELAEALGITLEELEAAQEAAYNTAIDEALDEGLITARQAERLREFGAAFPFGRRLLGWLSQNGIDLDAHLAQALNITPQELQEARSRAILARIDRAVEAGRISEDQAEYLRGRYILSTSESFRQAIRSAVEGAIAQAVEDGLITQSQADAVLERLDEQSRISPGLDGTHIFPLPEGFTQEFEFDDSGDRDREVRRRFTLPFDGLPLLPDLFEPLMPFLPDMFAPLAPFLSPSGEA